MATKTARFWASNNLEPKRSNRFVMYIGDFPHWFIHMSDKPSYKLATVKYYWLNHTFNYPSKIEWNPIKVTLYDPVHPDAAKTMLDVMNRGGYHFPYGPDDLTTISKEQMINALGGQILLRQVGADGVVVEEWVLKNPWVSSVDNGKLDFEKDDPVNVEIEITYDWAIMTIGEGWDIGEPNESIGGGTT
jgi:hypothetical protein